MQVCNPATTAPSPPGEPAQPVGIENGATLVCSDEVTGLLEVIRNEDGTLDRFVFHGFDGVTQDPANMATMAPCPPKSYLALPGMTHKIHCTPVILCVETCEMFTILNGEKLVMTADQVGQNPTTVSTQECQFSVDMPAVGADATLDNAAVLALLAGQTFDNGEPADGANVYLNELSITLGNLNDEAPDGAGGVFNSTACDASVESKGLTRNLEPGGKWVRATDPGEDIADFTGTLVANSVWVVCGEVSIQVDKSGNTIAKAEG